MVYNARNQRYLNALERLNGITSPVEYSARRAAHSVVVRFNRINSLWPQGESSSIQVQPAVVCAVRVSPFASSRTATTTHESSGGDHFIHDGS